MDCDLVVLDEVSRVNVPPMNALTKSVPDHARQVLADVIASGAVPVARLTEVFQQASKNRIVFNAHRINAEQMSERPQPGEHASFSFVDVTTRRAASAS